MRKQYVRKYEQNGVASAVCIGPECSRPAWSHELCQAHYSQEKRGKELKPLRPYRKPNRAGIEEELQQLLKEQVEVPKEILGILGNEMETAQ